MEEALIQQLLADPGLAAVFGERMSWGLRPQAEALPGLVLQLVSASPDYTLDGRQGLRGSLVQFDCWGSSYLEAKRGARALTAALDALAAPIKRAFIVNLRDTAEAAEGPAPGGSVTFYRSSIDARIWTAEP